MQAGCPAGDLPMPDAPEQDEPLPTPASGPLPASPAGAASPAGSAPRLPSIEPFADGEPLSTGRCGTACPESPSNSCANQLFHSRMTRLLHCVTMILFYASDLQMVCSKCSRCGGLQSLGLGDGCRTQAGTGKQSTGRRQRQARAARLPQQVQDACFGLLPPRALFCQELLALMPVLIKDAAFQMPCSTLACAPPPQDNPTKLSSKEISGLMKDRAPILRDRGPPAKRHRTRGPLPPDHVVRHIWLVSFSALVSDNVYMEEVPSTRRHFWLGRERVQVSVSFFEWCTHGEDAWGPAGVLSARHPHS
jgi:hypothetical protein